MGKFVYGVMGWAWVCFLVGVLVIAGTDDLVGDLLFGFYGGICFPLRIGKLN